MNQFSLRMMYGILCAAVVFAFGTAGAVSADTIEPDFTLSDEVVNLDTFETDIILGDEVLILDELQPIEVVDANIPYVDLDVSVTGDEVIFEPSIDVGDGYASGSVYAQAQGSGVSAISGTITAYVP